MELTNKLLIQVNYATHVNTFYLHNKHTVQINNMIYVCLSETILKIEIGFMQLPRKPETVVSEIFQFLYKKWAFTFSRFCKRRLFITENFFILKIYFHFKNNNLIFFLIFDYSDTLNNKIPFLNNKSNI